MTVESRSLWVHKENSNKVQILENHGKAYLFVPYPNENSEPTAISSFVFHQQYVPIDNALEGIKSDQDKRRYSLLPPKTLDEVVDVLEFGSKKYADNNWMYVENARTRYYDATLRHINAWWYGEQTDSETGLHHLGHAVCCLLFLMWFDLNKEVEHGADTDTQR